ncbi:MAG TPA: CarD family transcriptional regulator [Gaiellaceae bacterium]|nr:CarD family transcriptional regulator [Gaiellaceae bacterium]
MELKVGTVVAYPPHGIGTIAAREKKVVLGVEEEVVLIRLGNDLSVTLPVARAEEMLRPPATEADLKKVQKTLREEGVVSDEIWSKRLAQAQEKLRSGDPLDLAEIVRDGVKREQGRTANGTPIKLSTSERALHLKARELLTGEIEIARGIDREAAEAWIDAQLAASS